MMVSFQEGTCGFNIDAKTGQLARVGSEGFMESSANMFDRSVMKIPLGLGKVLGGVLGSEKRIKGRARKGEGKLISDALKTAADQIGPETLKAMDDALQSMVGRFVNDMGALEQEGSLQALASMDPIGELDTGTTTAADTYSESSKSTASCCIKRSKSTSF